MGVTLYDSLNNSQHSNDLGFIFQTKSIPYIAPKRQTVVEVQGRDGRYVFEDGYDDIQIELSCVVVGDTIFERRKKARTIASWLSKTVKLVFDYENDIEYKVIKVINNISATMFGREYKDEFAIIFECEPYQQQTFHNDDLSWEEAMTSWIYANIPWEGYDRIFLVSSGETIDVVNAGTYKALPIITLTGTAESVIMGGFTFTNLAGTVYIDCKNQVVYSISGGAKINKIANFSGNFPELIPGTNSFLIAGTITTLLIEFDYKNTYL